MAHNLEGLRIGEGAASMSYDIIAKGGRHVATVWSGAKVPTDSQARENALAFKAAPRVAAALAALLDAVQSEAGVSRHDIANAQRALSEFNGSG